jgi:hypothetical protein
MIYFHSSQCRLIPYLHQRPIFFKTNSSIVVILELIRGAQCLIEVIRSSGEGMWRVDAYQIPYYSRGIEGEKRTHPRFADGDWMRLDSALKKVVPNISRPKKSRHFLMHWMSVKLPDNFQMREHSWPCRFHIKVNKLVIDSTITKSCTFYDVCLFFSSLTIVSIFVYVEKI